MYVPETVTQLPAVCGQSRSSPWQWRLTSPASLPPQCAGPPQWPSAAFASPLSTVASARAIIWPLESAETQKSLVGCSCPASTKTSYASVYCCPGTVGIGWLTSEKLPPVQQAACLCGFGTRRKRELLHAALTVANSQHAGTPRLLNDREVGVVRLPPDNAGGAGRGGAVDGPVEVAVDQQVRVRVVASNPVDVGDADGSPAFAHCERDRSRLVRVAVLQ